MTQAIYIGVDGGGTKTKVRIEDSNGHLLGQAVAGPANVRLSVDGAWQSIYTAIDEILCPLGLSIPHPDYNFHAGFGLAGCEVVGAYHAFLTRPHFFKSIKLASDAHIACLGAHQGEDGAIIIVGTGSIGYQLQHGKSARVGGWGFPHDDEGSGAWLGLEAVRITLQWLDHRGEKSPLVEDIYGFFNHDTEKLIQWANAANATEFARLAPFVINHAQQEEVAAVRLMKKAAHAIDRIMAALAKMAVHQRPLPCALFGGIAPFLQPWLNDEWRPFWVTRQADATEGAILMARLGASFTAASL